MQGKVSHWKDMPAPGAPKLNPQWAQMGEKQWQQDQDWGAKPKMGGPPDWSDGQIDTSTWGGPAKQGGKPLTKDLIWASKQFRILTQMGYGKDEVENCLRAHNMDIENTLMELASRGEYLPKQKRDNGPMGGQPFSVSQWEPRGPPPPLKQQPGPQQQPPLRQPAMGAQGQAVGVVGGVGGVSGVGMPPMPSNDNLRLLVGRIQTAVHAGYVNPQILNQPLGPNTLQLLYQLLSQIRILDVLQCKPDHPISNPIKHNVMIVQTKQDRKSVV